MNVSSLCPTTPDPEPAVPSVFPSCCVILARDLGECAGMEPVRLFAEPSGHEHRIASIVEWRSIPDWPEYEISENGEARRIRSHNGKQLCRALKPTLNANTGYYSLCLCRNYKVKRIDIHRLVALAFLGPQPSAQHVVAHNDGSRTNNRSSDLRWATQGENLADCHSHGTAMVGSRNPMAKLDEIDVKAIRRMKAAGIPRPVIAAGYGIHKRRVFSILSRASWGHV